MCPDHSLLSAYFDGELDERWSKSIEEHVAQCDRCSGKLVQFSNLREILLDNGEPEIEMIKSNAWQHIQNRNAYLIHPHFWQKRFQVPVPLAVGLALVVLCLTVGLALSIGQAEKYDPFDNVTKMQLTGHELSSLEDIIKYLDSREIGFSSTFTLPQETELRVISEPTLIRAADYKRGRK